MHRLFQSLAVIAILTNLSFAASKKKKAAPKFDYYVLSLSWSPEHCAEVPKDKSTQCTGTRKFGFVVHGLWPNATSGPNPMNCAGPAYNPKLTTKDTLEIMPSADLIQHEWEKHGPCSGLDQAAYFKRVQDAWIQVTIPADLKNPDHQVSMSPADIRAKFAAANPSFPAAAFAVQDNGRFLQEVRVCLTKDLHGQVCPSQGDKRTSPKIILRPAK